MSDNFIQENSDIITLRAMANVFMPEALDPVGQEDDDVDNDGDSDKSDEYLKKRRKAVGAAINKRKKKLTTEAADATTSDDDDKEITEKKVKNKVVINPEMKESKDYDPMEDDEFDHDEAEENRGVSGKNNPKGGKRLLYKKREVKKEEVEQIEEKSVQMQRRVDRYLGRDKAKAKERLGRQNERREKKAALAAMEKQYKGMKSGIYSSYEPEGEQLNERPYQVMGYDKEGGKEKKVGKPVKSRKYADARASELSDTHKKTGGKYRSQYVEDVENVEERYKGSKHRPPAGWKPYGGDEKGPVPEVDATAKRIDAIRKSIKKK